MQTKSVLFVVSLLTPWISAPRASAQAFADQVVTYTAGDGAVKGYDNPRSALGAPSQTTLYHGAESGVDPFNPPWTADQLVSVGAGGSITVHVAGGIYDSPIHAFGVDFLVFGNNGFMVNDYSVPSTQWTTDGRLFTFDTPGLSRVSVSENGSDFYTLVPPAGVASTVDGLFPTDGAGSSIIPVDPRLNGESFKGANLDAIRGLYAGSAGGTGFDLSWAQKADGSPADLHAAHYVRVEVLDGKLEIDAVVSVPEPSLLALGGVGVAGLLWRPCFGRSLRSSRAGGRCL
jgi:hypothetical protein